MFHVEQFAFDWTGINTETACSYHVPRGTLDRCKHWLAKMTPTEIERLLNPYIGEGTCVPPLLYSQLATYLELLLKWNAQTNLTAIRVPEEIIRRHFGESLFAAQHLQQCETLLDFGSGAGFPGLPIHLLRPDIHVTLGESQSKKASFLREAVRTLGLKTEVWANRVEAMPADRRFDVVALRAVDKMEVAIAAASERAAKRMLLLTTVGKSTPLPAGFIAELAIPIPGATEQQVLRLARVGPPLG